MDRRPTTAHGQAAGLVSAVEGIWLQEGDLALTVRRIFQHANATSRDLYTSFGSRDALIRYVARDLADHVETWVCLRSSNERLSAALDRPAAWRALMLGRGPGDLPAFSDRLSATRAQFVISVGGVIQLAKLDGVVMAIHRGRLDRSVAMAASY